MLFISAPTQLVYTCFLYLSCTGAAKDKMQVFLYHQFVYYIQKIREFLDFIHYYQSLGRILNKNFIELHRATFKTFSDVRVKEINVNCIWESFSQQGGFSDLTTAKQEHAFIKAIHYIKYSMIHIAYEFLQHR